MPDCATITMRREQNQSPQGMIPTDSPRPSNGNIDTLGVALHATRYPNGSIREILILRQNRTVVNVLRQAHTGLTIFCRNLAGPTLDSCIRIRFAIARPGVRHGPRGRSKMAKVVVIGGSGHVGTYLVPRLVEAGHEVINVSRGQRQPYTPNAAWERSRRSSPTATPRRPTGTFGAQDRGARARHRHRHDLLHAGQRAAAGRGAAGQGAAFPPLRHDVGLRPQHHGARHRGPAAQRRSAPMASQKAAIETWLLGRGAPHRLSGDGVPPGPHRRAGLGAAQPGGAFQQRACSRRSRAATSWRCPISAWRRCITSMPTTWRRS